MLHSTTPTSFSLSLCSYFSSMRELPANSKEENSFKSSSNAQTQTTGLGLTLMCSFHNPDSSSIGISYTYTYTYGGSMMRREQQ
ncbi:hypothetical protein Gogos_020929 [Gossypium gossypioides]|uniref:Uncharacterized protein n=1 Tax=Gossypium gossypioides TaxID=34282 RepID=A0A7J9CZL4_GOSGO|nr:hypothetical protein [Gossypium gossypioides]